MNYLSFSSKVLESIYKEKYSLKAAIFDVEMRYNISDKELELSKKILIAVLNQYYFYSYKANYIFGKPKSFIEKHFYIVLTCTLEILRIKKDTLYQDYLKGKEYLCIEDGKDYKKEILEYSMYSSKLKISNKLLNISVLSSINYDFLQLIKSQYGLDIAIEFAYSNSKEIKNTIYSEEKLDLPLSDIDNLYYYESKDSKLFGGKKTVKISYSLMKVLSEFDFSPYQNLLQLETFDTSLNRILGLKYPQLNQDIVYKSDIIYNQNVNAISKLKLKNISSHASIRRKLFKEHDIVICNPPSSNLGLLKINKEANLFLSKKEIPNLIQNQRNLIEKSINLLKGKGVMLYIVFTMNKNEGEDLISTYPLEVIKQGTIFPFDYSSSGLFYAYLRKKEK